MLRKLFVITLIFGTLSLTGGGVFLYWGWLYITRDLPDFATLDVFRPPAVSRVFARDGTLIGEYFKERRYPVKLKEIPLMIQQAFLAAEDAGFYKHPGIDFTSIVRAAIKDFRAGRSTQGASTITQQVVKNMLLSSEKNYKRKIKEAILSYRLENRLSKDDILERYLNLIFFGNTAYGVKAAASLYFHKELKDVTLAEAALLAGLPKAPSRFSPVDYFPQAKHRQKYVLEQMEKAGFVTASEAAAAFAEKVNVYRASQRNVFGSPNFVTEVRIEISQRWKDLDVDVDGLEIYTTADTNAERFGARALRAGLRSVDKRRGWRGPLGTVPGKDRQKFRELYAAQIPLEFLVGKVYPALVMSVNLTQGTALVDVGPATATIDLRKPIWARRFLSEKDHVVQIRLEEILRPGDVIEVTPADEKEGEGAPPKLPPGMIANLELDQTPQLEGAIVLLEPNSGRVRAMIGGYDFESSHFNRVTQAARQPGSTFKPIVYLAGVDSARYTASTIVHDNPRSFRVGREVWSPGNFDGKYLGAITLQTALERSRNLVSVDVASRIGIDGIIRYARKLGITSPLGRNLSLALGSSEVTPLELTRAYGVLAAKGILFGSVFIERIVDRNGRVVYDYEREKLSKAVRVVDEESAFVMAHMMKGVVERGTATSLKALGRPIAGKTGTSNDFMDAWFIGFTPSWVTGIWVGFDRTRSIGEKETGGKVAAPIFLDFMKEFLDYEEEKAYDELLAGAKEDAARLGIDYVPPERPGPLDFSVPDGVDPYWVNRNTGLLSSVDTPGAIYEYFKKGTEPGRPVPVTQQTVNSYLESPDL